MRVTEILLYFCPPPHTFAFHFSNTPVFGSFLRRLGPRPGPCCGPPDSGHSATFVPGDEVSL